MLKTEAKGILVAMAPQVGVEGMALAGAFIHAFGGIGRGVNGAGAEEYLTSQVEKGKLRIERGSWIYSDPHGRRVVVGLLGDRMMPGVVKIAMLLHREPFRAIGRCELDPYELAEKLANTAVKVERELRSRSNRSILVAVAGRDYSRLSR